MENTVLCGSMVIAYRCGPISPCFFFSSRRRHTIWTGDWSSDVCSSDLLCGDVGGRERIGELQLDRGKAGRLGRCETVEEGQLGKEQADVGGEFRHRGPLSQRATRG